jgi:hypothetical protein
MRDVFSRAMSPFNRVRRIVRGDGVLCLDVEWFAGPYWMRRIVPLSVTS